jgi:hypothetical protein
MEIIADAPMLYSGLFCLLAYRSIPRIAYHQSLSINFGDKSGLVHYGATRGAIALLLPSVTPWPPITTVPAPLATFCWPPVTLASRPLAVLLLPPVMLDWEPLAVFPEPPLMLENRPLAMPLMPPLILTPSLLIVLPSPATRPPKAAWVKLFNFPITKLCDPPRPP